MDEQGVVMDAASLANDDASHPQFSDEEGEGPREGMPPLDEDDEEEEEEGEENNDREVLMRRQIKGNDEEEEEEGEENNDREVLMRRQIKGNDEEDDGEGEGDGLQQVEGSNELRLLRKNGEQLFIVHFCVDSSNGFDDDRSTLTYL